MSLSDHTSNGEQCWCSSIDFIPSPHPDYFVCRECGAAKLRAGLETGQTKVDDEKTHLYGAHYWDEHMKSFGFPTLAERARMDLAERALYWLSTLLNYQTPPGRALEIGCAHGGFVKLLATAGFESLGMEMSPEVISLATGWFGVNIVQGPIEFVDQQIGTFDAVLMFDVVEHLADPVAVMQAVVSHISESGVLVLQTPKYADVTSATWTHGFKPPEHTFLFSPSAIQRLLHQLGFRHIVYEPPLFPGDMFVIASRQPLRHHTKEEIETRLAATPNGRVVQALLDLDVQRRSDSLPEVARKYGAKRLAVATALALGQWLRRLVGR